MKGIGRNIKYVSGTLLNLLFCMYLTWIVVMVLFSFMVENPLEVFMRDVTFSAMLITFVLLVSSVASAENFSYNMVFLGSARKPVALSVLISTHTFQALQMVILFCVVMLFGNSMGAEFLKICPLGALALWLLMNGIGYFFVVLALRGHKVCVGILGFILAFIAIIVMVAICAEISRTSNMNFLIPFNSIWSLLTGLCVDLIGAFSYYKTVTKVDLKLA